MADQTTLKRRPGEQSTAMRIEQKHGSFGDEDLEHALSRLLTRLEGTKLDSSSRAFASPEDEEVQCDGADDDTTLADVVSQLEGITLHRKSGRPLSSKTLLVAEEAQNSQAASQGEVSRYLSTLTGRRRYWARKMLRAGIAIETIRAMHEATDFYSLSRAERLRKIAEKYREH